MYIISPTSIDRSFGLNHLLFTSIKGLLNVSETQSSCKQKKVNALSKDVGLHWGKFCIGSNSLQIMACVHVHLLECSLMDIFILYSVWTGCHLLQ